MLRWFDQAPTPNALPLGKAITNCVCVCVFEAPSCDPRREKQTLFQQVFTSNSDNNDEKFCHSS